MATPETSEIPGGTVTELQGQRKRFPVPPGLKCLLEEMSREILKAQPEDIYLFLANYLEQKLRKQCNGESGEDPGRSKIGEPGYNPDAKGIRSQEGMKMMAPGPGPAGELMGEEMTGTNHLDPDTVSPRMGEGQGQDNDFSAAPFGYGPDGKPIIGPNKNAPFGYAPDGRPLTSQCPYAPNGYGPDGRPLVARGGPGMRPGNGMGAGTGPGHGPGIACTAPFGVGPNGIPLSTHDPKAPFGYLSDGLPVATNDPSAPFGFDAAGNPLTARDPNAPLGYGINGQPNTEPEVIAFCDDSTTPSRMGVSAFLSQGTNTSQGNLSAGAMERIASASGQREMQGDTANANGVMYFGQGGTNVILSYDPSPGGNKGSANTGGNCPPCCCTGANPDCALLMQQAMANLLERVSTMLGGIAMQNAGLGPRSSPPPAPRAPVDPLDLTQAPAPVLGPVPIIKVTSPDDLQIPLTGTGNDCTPLTGTQGQIQGLEAPKAVSTSCQESETYLDKGPDRESRTRVKGAESQASREGKHRRRKCTPEEKAERAKKCKQRKDAEMKPSGDERRSSSQRRRCIPKEMRQFAPAGTIGPDGKFIPGSPCGPVLDVSCVPPASEAPAEAPGKPPPQDELVGSADGKVVDKPDLDVVDTSLTPDDSETLTLLTTVGTLLDTIEDTGLTRMDPIQLCSDKTLQHLTQVGEKMLVALRAHLTKMKSSEKKVPESSDPFMAQISRDAHDALEIGAESLDVAVGLLKDVTALCGEMAANPELMEKCAGLARATEEGDKEAVEKEMVVCQQAFQTHGTTVTTRAAAAGPSEGTLVGDQTAETQTESAKNMDEGSGTAGEGEEAKDLGNQGVSQEPSTAETQNPDEELPTGVLDQDRGADGEEGTGTGALEQTRGADGEGGAGTGTGAAEGGSKTRINDALVGSGAGAGAPEGTGPAPELLKADQGSTKTDMSAKPGLDSGASGKLGDPSAPSSVSHAIQRNANNLLGRLSTNANSRKIVFITVSFLVGAAIGYALARSYGLVGPNSRLSDFLFGGGRPIGGCNVVRDFEIASTCNRCSQGL